MPPRQPAPQPLLPPYLRVERDAVQLALKVQPRSSRNAIGAARGAELRVTVTAPPVDAAANEALLRLLASTLGCPRHRVVLTRGGASRHKLVRIHGMTAHEIAAKLANSCP